MQLDSNVVLNVFSQLFCKFFKYLLVITFGCNIDRLTYF